MTKSYKLSTQKANFYFLTPKLRQFWLLACFVRVESARSKLLVLEILQPLKNNLRKSKRTVRNPMDWSIILLCCCFTTNHFCLPKTEKFWTFASKLQTTIVLSKWFDQLTNRGGSQLKNDKSCSAKRKPHANKPWKILLIVKDLRSRIHFGSQMTPVRQISFCVPTIKVLQKNVLFVRDFFPMRKCKTMVGHLRKGAMYHTTCFAANPHCVCELGRTAENSTNNLWEQYKRRETNKNLQ